MSLVLAIKDKDRYVFGADKQGTLGGNIIHTATKIWEVKGSENEDGTCAIMGGVGSARASQVVQYLSGMFDKNANIDEEYLVTTLAPYIANVLGECGIHTKIGLEEDGSVMTLATPNSFLFAYKDKCWMIHQDLSIIEVGDYVAIGSGSDVARGVLFATKDQNPFERIVLAIQAANEETAYVDDSVEVLLTKEYPEDQDLYNKATGIDVIMEQIAKEQKKAIREQKKKEKEAKSKTSEDVIE